MEFLTDAYDSERLKTLSVWSLVTDDQMEFRAAPRARTPHEHMVHQCVSEDTWMRAMLDVQPTHPALPPSEDRLAFLSHYADTSAERLRQLRQRDTTWWNGTARFFDVDRTRAWIMLRRLTHSAHHRGQFTTILRLLGAPMYSTYGPTADTGGLFVNAAPTIYRYPSVDALRAAEARGGEWPPLPGPGAKSPTERPEIRESTPNPVLPT
ncbi:MAG: DinB family protein [Gemmatimonadaceae bacterium]